MTSICIYRSPWALQLNHFAHCSSIQSMDYLTKENIISVGGLAFVLGTAFYNHNKLTKKTIQGNEYYSTNFQHK